MPPPLLPWRHSELPDVETAPLQPPTPQYSSQQTKAPTERQTKAGPSQESINRCLVYMFQEAPNSHWEAMTSPDKEKWLEASQEEYKGLTEMGIWKLVDRPSNQKISLSDNDSDTSGLDLVKLAQPPTRPSSPG